jgi:hypothetical protein
VRRPSPAHGAGEQLSPVVRPCLGEDRFPMVLHRVLRNVQRSSREPGVVARGELAQHLALTPERIFQPSDDPKYVIIELDFATQDQAETVRDFLSNRVWSTPENAPALVGTPLTRILTAEASARA